MRFECIACAAERFCPEKVKRGESACEALYRVINDSEEFEKFYDRVKPYLEVLSCPKDCARNGLSACEGCVRCDVPKVDYYRPKRIKKGKRRDF